MDDETREALEMTKEDLLRLKETGRPATVRKSEDFVQRMKRVVDESTRDDADRVETMILWPSGKATERIVLSPVGTRPTILKATESQKA